MQLYLYLLLISIISDNEATQNSLRTENNSYHLSQHLLNAPSYLQSKWMRYTNFNAKSSKAGSHLRNQSHGELKSSTTNTNHQQYGTDNKKTEALLPNVEPSSTSKHSSHIPTRDFNFIYPVEERSNRVNNADEKQIDSVVSSMVAVSGRVVQLPCLLALKDQGDSPKLILWYKSTTKTPIVSFDGRPRLQSKGFSGSSPTDDNSRSSVSAETASLTLKMVALADEGLYECRVDFFKSPTHNHFVNLTVIEPIRSLEILDSSGHFPGIGGISNPYVEGSPLLLKCFARQGVPKATITWLRNGTPLSAPLTSSVDGVIQSELSIERLQRSWSNSTLTCQAKNSDRLPALEKKIFLRMHLLPETVRVNGPPSIQSGQTATLSCSTAGSYPPAQLTWKIDGKTRIPIYKNKQYGSVTSSTLVLNVTRLEDGQEVLCEAVNPKVPNIKVFNSTVLNVLYPPIATTSLGRSISPGPLKEGSDVYFTCEVKANPADSLIEWFHENNKQVQNKSAGVLISGDSLVIQGAKRYMAGRYFCVATNSVNSTKSLPVLLRIKYKPVCASAPITYFIYDEPINVTCSISSYPPVHNIEWRWNGSGETHISEVEDIVKSTKSVLNDKVTAQFTVIPSKAAEDRHLSCYGFNEMGNQTSPCNFSINVASVPAPLSSCRLANITASSLSLMCETAYTPNAVYRAEVYLANNSLFANVTSQQPSFNVSRLDPATNYQIKVYVAHGPATSEPVLVSAFTSRNVRRENSNIGEPEVGFFTVVILTSLTSVLVILLIALIIKVLWFNRRRAHNFPGKAANSNFEENISSKLEKFADNDDVNASSGFGRDDSFCPDVVSNIETNKLLSTPNTPMDYTSDFAATPCSIPSEMSFLDSGQFGQTTSEVFPSFCPPSRSRRQSPSPAQVPSSPQAATIYSLTSQPPITDMDCVSHLHNDPNSVACSRSTRDHHNSNSIGSVSKSWQMPGFCTQKYSVGSENVKNTAANLTNVVEGHKQTKSRQENKFLPGSNELVCGVDQFFTAEESVV